MEKRTGREEEKTKKEEGMKILDVLEGLYMLLWIEFILACGCMVLSWFIPFEDCFYIICTFITCLNGIATINSRNKLEERNKEDE